MTNEIQYHLTPNEVSMTVWFADTSKHFEQWDCSVNRAGVVDSVTDRDGNVYRTLEDMKAAGVKRFTLNLQHVQWVE